MTDTDLFDSIGFCSVSINLLFIFYNFAVNQLAYKRLQSLCNELDIDDTLVSTGEQSLIEDLILCGFLYGAYHFELLGIASLSF